ncbi:hypothetical protein C9374_007388 [Naegleria lovaniensis]|uniref:Uncharacterized protein n=1 Tax=Naegleria lovaniensis TaxID=51637 RepID=A0AA88GKM7_NAELO|nr:uncharacterized protein C9374_007388 [Naegleria lovaniensis]KAG2379249.1 hypothetical protein C9374_007388 [Naegleria lovaniensis]
MNKANNNSAAQAKKPQQKKVVKKVKKTLANPFQPQFKILSSEQQTKVLKLIQQYPCQNIIYEVTKISELISSSQSHQVKLVIFPDAHYLEINPIQIDFLRNQCSYANIPFINLEINVQSFTEALRCQNESLAVHCNNFLKAIAFKESNGNALDHQTMPNILQLLTQENNFGPSISTDDLFHVLPFIASSFRYEQARVEDVKPLKKV